MYFEDVQVFSCLNAKLCFDIHLLKTTRQDIINGELTFCNKRVLLLLLLVCLVSFVFRECVIGERESSLWKERKARYSNTLLIINQALKQRDDSHPND